MSAFTGLEHASPKRIGRVSDAFSKPPNEVIFISRIPTHTVEHAPAAFAPALAKGQLLQKIVQSKRLCKESKPAESILLEHVAHVDFSYFGKVQNQLGWHDSWQHSLSLPL